MERKQKNEHILEDYTLNYAVGISLLINMIGVICIK